ncbi:ORF6N domain-containing protein [Pseudorhodobacter sp.]|uniref:ORF6N domain-containing protein n=1 Tax=Pseudorhodobacter sp. TaxID=1934400 RepID=UPI002648FB09|nr:ORF6N domain-containing protein [Pseudorhodobacter sp.]MDN5785726.1 ORF6N domain-containing protein [Pseudorhodobacter sp.]
MTTLFDIAGVQARIFNLPNRPPFMIAVDLAEVYGTVTKALNQAVSRNAVRFPEDFMFTLTEDEIDALRSQSVTAKAISMKVRYEPKVFTHAGAYAISAVLKTDTAAQVSVVVHRAFAAMEQQVIADMQFTLRKVHIEASQRRIRYLVIQGTQANMPFDQIRLLGSYSGPKLAQALRECLHLGLIDQLPPGTPDAIQADLFANG